MLAVNLAVSDHVFKKRKTKTKEEEEEEEEEEETKKQMNCSENKAMGSFVRI